MGSGWHMRTWINGWKQTLHCKIISSRFTAGRHRDKSSCGERCTEQNPVKGLEDPDAAGVSSCTMKLPSGYQSRKYLLLELIAAGLVLLLLILKLAKPYIRFHGITDSAWLIACFLLVFPELTRAKPLAQYPAWMQAPATSLLCGLYLFLYHFFIVLFRLKYLDVEWLLHAGAATLFLLALLQRLREQGIELHRLHWKNTIRYPHWPLTVGLTLCMFSPFFKMTRISALQSSYAPQFGYNYYSGWGYNTWGYNYYSYQLAIKGHLAYWGHFACLLLAFLLLLHLLMSTTERKSAQLELFIKIGLPVIFTWWMLGAKGYNTLKSFGNILFLTGLLISAMAVYFPAQLRLWLQKLPK